MNKKTDKNSKVNNEKYRQAKIRRQQIIAKKKNTNDDEDEKTSWIHAVLLCIPFLYYASMIFLEPQKKDIYDANIKLMTKDIGKPYSINEKPYLTAYTRYDYYPKDLKILQSIMSNAKKQGWKEVPKEFFKDSSTVVAYCDKGTVVSVNIYSKESVTIYGNWNPPSLGIFGSGDYCYEEYKKESN